MLKLSDAYQTEGGCLEFEAVMLNINYGHNRELMEKCRRLEEYSIFVHTVRMYVAHKKRDLKESIALAMNECIEKGILKDILITQRAEVRAMLLETFDKELYEKDLVVNAKEEGRKEEKISVARQLLDVLEKTVIAEKVGLPLEVVEELAKQ